MSVTRDPEIRFLAGPHQFRNLQTDLFYEKRIFIGPKNGTFYLSNWIKLCQTIIIWDIFLFGPKIRKFWLHTRRCQAVYCL